MLARMLGRTIERSQRRRQLAGQVLINAVVSMGRRNTGPKSNLQVFQRLNSFESADSKKTLPCLGLIEYAQRIRSL